MSVFVKTRIVVCMRCAEYLYMCMRGRVYIYIYIYIYIYYIYIYIIRVRTRTLLNNDWQIRNKKQYRVMCIHMCRVSLFKVGVVSSA